MKNAKRHWEQLCQRIKEHPTTAEAGNKVIHVYGNAVKSIPAVLNGLRVYNNLQKYPDRELEGILSIAETMIKVTERPLTERDVNGLVTKLDKLDNEEK